MLISTKKALRDETLGFAMEPGNLVYNLRIQANGHLVVEHDRRILDHYFFLHRQFRRGAVYANPD